MEDELLQELDSILKPCIDRAWQDAVRLNKDTDPRGAFLDFVQVQIDNTKVALSNSVHKIDLAVKSSGNSAVERAAAEIRRDFLGESDHPKINTSDYVKETANGFEVWDGVRWVQLSKDANIKVDVFQDPMNDNRPAVRLWAQDKSTKKEVLFVDNDIPEPGWDLGISRTGDFDDSLMDQAIKESYWEDPWYKVVKNGRAVGSATSGALSIRQVGNLTPWKGLKDGSGWYRNKEGLYQSLAKQKGKGAGGYQKSVKNAAKKAKVFKGAGKVLMGVSFVISGYEIQDAVRKDYTNKNEVITKATVDVAITLIGAYGGPVGWVIAGTYFILNVSGAFGDWGTPSGISNAEFYKNRFKRFKEKNEERFRAIRFNLEYTPSIEELQENYYIEERTFKKDKLNVRTPRVLYLKN